MAFQLVPSPVVLAAAGGIVFLFWVAVYYIIRRRYLGLRERPGLTLPKPRQVDPRLLRSASSLSESLRKGEFTSVDLVEAAIQHIMSVNPHLNAMVFNRFDLARKEAAAADAILAKARKGKGDWNGVGWLTGVPITVKECIQVSGCPNTSGHPKRVDLLIAQDAPVVRLLRDAGAVILGVTNTSELCMWMESTNPVYGTTNNAYDVKRIVGGSSGGEGCGISALFAPVGIGSDIGGSIRMPAYFSGVFGHKPSACLIPNRGQMPGCTTLGHFLLTTGPLARHADDLYPMVKTLTKDGFMEDPATFAPCPAIRDPAHVKIRDLTVYCIEDLGLLFRADKHQRRAARRAAELLSHEYGCAVKYVDFRKPETVPPGWERLSYSVPIWTHLTSSGGERTFTDFMSQGYDGGFKLSREVLTVITGTNKHTFPAIALCVIEKLQVLKPKFLLDRDQRYADQLRHAIERELVANNGVIIMPTYPTAVPLHNEPFLNPFQWIYTGIWNAMRTPATAIPMWLDDDQKTPLGVQCVGPWGRDDQTIAVAVALEDVGGGYRPPSWVSNSKA